MNSQHHLIRLRLITECLILITQPEELFLAVALADIHAELNERLVDHILKGIRLCGIGRALDGDRPLVVGAGGGTPGAVFLLHIHSHTTVHADAIVAACLSGSRQEDIAQRLHRALPHHAVGRNAVDAVRPLPGVVWAEFRIRYQ